MNVYVVSYCAAYEGEQLLGVFSDYVKAREFEVNWKSKCAVGDCDSEWVEVRKVELDRIYDGFAVGEEM